MKFLLVTSFKKELVKVWVCQETSPVGSLQPPVDLASIAAVVRSLGHEPKILDLRLYNNPLSKYQETIRDYSPDFVVLNITTTSANYDYELLSRTPDGIRKICFGTHAQSLPEETIRKGADFILIGDPEASIASLIKNGSDGSINNGVLTKGNTNKSPLYWDDLDTMPFPALDLLDMRAYYAPYVRRGNQFTLLLGSRGCPHPCTFCLYPVLFGGKIRYRSVKNMVDEIQFDYDNYNVKEFIFLDATFNTNQKRVMEFCDELISRGINISWSCNMRVSPVTKDMLERMKDAGCRRIYYGVEDQEFLKEIRKGITKDATFEAFKKTKEAGILTVAFIMLFPRDDIDEATYARNILSVLDMLKADAFQCNVSIPFPGTELYDKYTNRKDLADDWNLFDPHSCKLPYESSINLIKIRKRIYRGFLVNHPIRALKIVKDISIKSLFYATYRYIRSNF